MGRMEVTTPLMVTTALTARVTVQCRVVWAPG